MQRSVRSPIDGVYFWLEENFVTDFVPSEMACFANSPGRMRRTAVWISREEMVDFFEYDASSTSAKRMRIRDRSYGT